MCRWVEKYLVHSQGDYFGRPFRLTVDQKRFLYRAYELRPDGRRVYRRVVRGRPTGAGKTELAAAIGLAELMGPARCAGFDEAGRPIPVRVTSPDIPVAAGSFGQADLLYGAAKVMVTEGPLSDFVEAYDTEMLLVDGPGQMYRVAAAAGTNEGLRPTFFVADETHEWTDRKRRVHVVIMKSLSKRRDAWALDITTAGVLDAGSVAEDAYKYGKRLQAGEVDNDAWLFDWLEAPEDLDVRDPEQLREAVRFANPEAFIPLDELVAQVADLPEHEQRRYHLNQWVRGIQTWEVAGVWDDLADAERVVEDGVQIALGFDGSYSGDSTALVGCTVEERPHLFVVKAWEREEAAPPGWRVPIDDAEQAIRDACAKWHVSAVNADPFRWQRSIQALADEGYPMQEFPTTSAPRMVAATAQFTDAAMADARGLTHDGSPALARHVGNCVLKIDGRGPRIVKEHKMSTKRIDLAVAALLAHDGALRGLAGGGVDTGFVVLEDDA